MRAKQNFGMDIIEGGVGEEGPAPTEDGPAPLTKASSGPDRAHRSRSSSNLLNTGAGNQRAPRRRSSMMASTG